MNFQNSPPAPLLPYVYAYENEFAKEKVIMRDCGCKEYHYMVSEDRDLSRHWHFVLLFNREGEYVKLIQRVPPRGKRVQKIA